MQNYLRLLRQILDEGTTRETRSGETIAIFGKQLRWNLQDGFPATTVKKLQFYSVAAELAGFLRAETDAAKMGSSIWIKDAMRWSGTSYMGRIYGYQWRKWNRGGVEIDQLADIVERITVDPMDRRLLVTAWNPGELHLGCLPPCHYAFQFFVDNGKLSCMFHMRSVDCFLGLPFDIASYALLTHIIAQQTNLQVGNLIGSFADTHIYTGHTKQVKLILEREPLPLPQLQLSSEATIDNFDPMMAELVNYEHHGVVSAELYTGQTLAYTLSQYGMPYCQLV